MSMTKELIEKFKQYLIEEEKSSATLEKYIRDVTAFFVWLAGCKIEKLTVLRYKEYLIEKYSSASVNSILSSLNCFFEFSEWRELKVKMLKIQRPVFAERNKELTKSEYEKLLNAAVQKKNKRLYYLMQTLCASGIRVSELKAITIEAVRAGRAVINCKGKTRQILLPKDLCKMLKEFAKMQKIKSGSIFVTKTGKPLDRGTIWKMMKALCRISGVSREKVFPHNLRHLFARTYYKVQKDIVRLADILGHSSVNTTRIYTMETGDIHRRQIQKLGLLRI